MAMYPCKQCSSNDWKFEYQDKTGTVKATCKKCKVVVQFLTRRQRRINAGLPIGTNLASSFQNVNGKTYKLEADGRYWEVDFVKVKKGHLKLKVIGGSLENSPLVAIQESPVLSVKTDFYKSYLNSL